MTVQAQILELIARLQRELNMAVVLITHDLGVVAEVTDRIVVMYAGKIVESATAPSSKRPSIPTWGLLQSIPRLDKPRDEALVPIPRPTAEPDLAPERVLVPPALSVRARAPPAGRAGLEPVPDDPATRSPACCRARRASGSGPSCARAGPEQARAAVELEEEPA